MRTLRTGVAPGGRALAASMPRAYGAMTDAELRAIWAFLQTVPAKGEKTARQLTPPANPGQRVAGAARAAAPTAP
jgi:hypothetical protein